MIQLVKDKEEKIKDINPNVFHNRFDIKYNGDYDILNCNGTLVPVHFEYNLCMLGLYTRKMNKKDFKELKRYIFKHFPKVEKLYLFFSYMSDKNIKPSPHWHIDLPETIEKFDSTLSSKTRYNTKWYPKIIKREIGDFYFETINANNCPENIVNVYLKWKKELYNFNWWGTTTMEYLKWAGVTDVYVMKTQDEILALGFVCITDKNAFFENFSYNPKYKKYSCGMVLYHYIISDLIKRKLSRFYLLGGNYEYKRRFNGINTMTYTGYINKYNNNFCMYCYVFFKFLKLYMIRLFR